MSTIPPEAKFRLDFSKKGYVQSRRGKWVQDEDRYKSLPVAPQPFLPKVGDYKTVSEEAVRLNEAQIRSGFLDWLFAPELVNEP